MKAHGWGIAPEPDTYPRVGSGQAGDIAGKDYKEYALDFLCSLD